MNPAKAAILQSLCNKAGCAACNKVRESLNPSQADPVKNQGFVDQALSTGERMAQILQEELRAMGIEAHVVATEADDAEDFGINMEDSSVVLEAPGYESLALVLKAAFDQASIGKGDGLPFEMQPMQTIAQEHTIGFITGQARKKMEEALGMLTRGEADAAIKELLGAIVYTAGAVVFIENNSEADHGMA